MLLWLVLACTTQIHVVTSMSRTLHLEVGEPPLEPLSPATEPPVVAGCGRDNLCKGDRICTDGACVAPWPRIGSRSTEDRASG